MSLRIRWFHVTPFDKEALKKLQTEFCRQEYSDRKPRGFSHMSSEGTALKGVFCERFDFTTQVEDPFGRMFDVKRVEFETTLFNFALDRPVLELTNAPRSVGTFLNIIAQTLGFKIAIHPLEVDLSKWLKAVSPALDSVTVTGVSLADIALSNAVAAKVSVIGTKEVRLLMKKFVGEHPKVLTRLQLSGTYRHIPFRCELFNNARASVLEGVEEELTPLFRRGLSVALS